MSHGEVIVVEEADRQFEFIQALKKLDFYAARNLLHFGTDDDDDDNDDEQNDNNKRIDSIVDKTSNQKKEQQKDTRIDYLDDDEDSNEDNEAEKDNDSPKSDSNQEPVRAIDIINKKIAHLDQIFESLDYIRPVDPPSFYEKQPDSKELENLAHERQIEQKQFDLFAGIYALKNVYFDIKTNIPLSFEMNQENVNSKNKPKLVELYQFSQYDKRIKISLPHGVSLNDSLRKVLQSINILEKQPHYRRFLYRQMFSKPCRYIIHDTFWYCFLERYQKLETIQLKYFDRVARNYAKLIFSNMEPRYRDTFLKSFPNLLAMSVYTLFGACFPESHMTHFGDDFKEFVCHVAWLWVTGCKPSARSFATWNLRALDPATAVFAQEVLDNKNQHNIVNEIEKLGTTFHFQQSSSNFNSDRSGGNKTSVSSSLSRRRAALLPQDIEDIISVRSSSVVLGRKLFQSAQKPESHPVGRGAEFEQCLFDLLGHSPLVDYFLYINKARKINNAETLVHHPNLVKLPPIDAPTYRKVIEQSVKVINKHAKDFKELDAKQRSDYEKLEKARVTSMREYTRKRERLLENSTQVKIMGELLMMNHRRDPNSVGTNLDKALKKAFKNSSRKQRE